MAKTETIDAGAELDRIAGERGASSLGSDKKPSPPGSRMFLAVVLAAVLGAGGYVTWKAAGFSKEAAAQPEKAATRPLNRQGSDWVPAPAAPTPAPPPPPPAAAPAEAANDAGKVADASSRRRDSDEPSPEELIRMRRLAPDLNNGGGSPQAEAQPVADTSSGSGTGPLADQLQPVRLNGARAGVLSNRDMLLTQGSMLDCQLETKIVSTVPGMTTCFITRDIYSTNGRVVLLDRGSKVVGQYQGGMTQGQARIFVLWTRVETPEGVVINLDSPGTGPLGEGGLGGWVDTHFWERFGGAIMLSLIGDVGEFISNKASEQSDGDRITFENTSEGAQELATEALRNSINIPPTLYKNQGERLQIFVARDLDFSGVYRLERKY